MFTLKIADNTADELMKDILLQDYRGLTQQVQEFKARALESSVLDYALEDLEFSERVLAAMPVIMEYYIGEDWRSNL
jgi:hypothetical protein